MLNWEDPVKQFKSSGERQRANAVLTPEALAAVERADEKKAAPLLGEAPSHPNIEGAISEKSIGVTGL